MTGLIKSVSIKRWCFLRVTDFYEIDVKSDEKSDGIYSKSRYAGGNWNVDIIPMLSISLPS